MKVGDKVKVTRNIPTVDGTLYEGEICKIDAKGFPDKDMRITDAMGRIWYVDVGDVKLIGDGSGKK